MEISQAARGPTGQGTQQWAERTVLSWLVGSAFRVEGSPENNTMSLNTQAKPL